MAKNHKNHSPKNRIKNVPLPKVGVLDIVDYFNDDNIILARLRGGTHTKTQSPLSFAWHGHSRPKKGDVFLCRLQKGDNDGGDFKALPIKSLTGAAKVILWGIALKQAGKLTLQPIDKKGGRDIFYLSRKILADYYATNEGAGEIKNHHLLSVQMKGRHIERIIENHGECQGISGLITLTCHQHDLPLSFPEPVTKEIKKINPNPDFSAESKKRKNLCALPFVTIDGEDAKDFDDAVYCEKQKTGGYRALIAIADVGHYVHSGSALDIEAARRGNSVYLPNFVVPMLPEGLSNNLCSLKPLERRLTIVADLLINDKGMITERKFYRAIISSHARLTYNNMQSFMDGKNKGEQVKIAPIENNLSEAKKKKTYQNLCDLHQLYIILQSARDARGALALDLPERAAFVNDDGLVEKMILRQQQDAHRLIEEMMIAANISCAIFLKENRLPVMYRNHEPPANDNIDSLRSILKSMGYNFAKGIRVDAKIFNQLLEQASEKGQRHIVDELILRSQSQAQYGVDNKGHFGLNLTDYCHFTSPIRRYADLIVHRALIKLLDGGDVADALETFSNMNNMRQYFDDVAANISKSERLAMVAERDALDRIAAYLMNGKTGDECHGVVRGFTNFALFLRLDDVFSDAILPLKSLPKDFYHLCDDRTKLVGDKGGVSFSLGDPIHVRLVDANPITGQMQCHYMNGGKILDAKARKKLIGKSSPRHARKFRR